MKDLLCPHTKQGTDEAKNTDRTSLKMSATVESMDYQIQLPCGWEESQTSSLSFILLSKSAILAHEGINMSFRPCFLPPFVHFPSPISLSPSSLSSFYVSLCSLLLFSCPSERVDVGQSQHHSSAVDTCSLWPAPANLDEWRKGQGEAGLPPWTSQSYRLSLGRFLSDRVSLLISSSSWKSDSQNIIIFISLCPREVPLGTGWRGRFLCKPVGQSSTDDLQMAGFWAWCP